MLFKVDPITPIRKTNENIDTIAEFLPCNDKTLKYVFLMYDYDSPYARLPKLQREEQVLVALGYVKQGSIDSFMSRNRQNICAAIEAFNKLQYNSNFESLISLKTQIELWNKLLRKEDKTDKEETVAHKVFDKMPEYIKRIKELEEIVGYREDADNEAEEELTSVERYLQAKKERELKK